MKSPETSDAIWRKGHDLAVALHENTKANLAQVEDCLVELFKIVESGRYDDKILMTALCPALADFMNSGKLGTRGVTYYAVLQTIWHISEEVRRDYTEHQHGLGRPRVERPAEALPLHRLRHRPHDLPLSGLLGRLSRERRAFRRRGGQWSACAVSNVLLRA
jgi:hypothetical protein